MVAVLVATVSDVNLRMCLTGCGERATPAKFVRVEEAGPQSMIVEFRTYMLDLRMHPSKDCSQRQEFKLNSEHNTMISQGEQKQCCHYVGRCPHAV